MTTMRCTAVVRESSALRSRVDVRHEVMKRLLTDGEREKDITYGGCKAHITGTGQAANITWLVLYPVLCESRRWSQARYCIDRLQYGSFSFHTWKQERKERGRNGRRRFVFLARLRQQINGMQNGLLFVAASVSSSFTLEPYLMNISPRSLPFPLFNPLAYRLRFGALLTVDDDCIR